MESLDIGVSGPLTFERIGNGQSNLTFAVTDAADGRWVLRRPPLGTLLASAHDVAREYRILSALQDTAVPVPTTIALTDDPAVTDAPLVLMSHVDGLVVDSPAVAGTLSEERRRAIGEAMPATLGKIHAVDLESTGLVDLASHKPYAARQLKRWSAQWEQSKTREVPDIERLATALAASAPEQTEVSLVHGDFHLSNIITSGAGEGNVDDAIVAVVDWELCTLGDPLADVGALLAYWSEADDDNVGMFMSSTLPGFPKRNELVDLYAAATGRDVSAVGYWHALALWKLSVIAEGVMRRAIDDERNRARDGSPTTDLVDGIIGRAVATAEEAGIL
ncbi:MULTISPECIES: phosphotransferase family protein [Nocardiaceae]|nr:MULTISPECIES: phosphotransferase family protein [Rhodococcus]